MRILAALLLCFTTLACSNVSLSKDDLSLYCKSRIYKPFILPKEVADAHPRIVKQLRAAMNRWEMSAPVDFHILDGMMGPIGSVSIIFGYYPTVYDLTGKNTLGFYNSDLKLLFFNEDQELNTEKFSDDSIYKTCLHELGHTLGLPHVIGKSDENGEIGFFGGRGFDIVLPTLEEAKKCIMFPVASDKEQRDLTPLEILWVRHALMHDLNLTSFLGNCFYEKDDS
jgi:hypothetical protein